MTAGELCTRTVLLAHAAEPVVEAARRMRDAHVGSLVIVEETPDGRRPTGIVTDRDLLFALVEDATGARTVGSVARRALVTAQESEPAHAALERMRQHGVRRLPVVDARGALAGILAYDDLVEWVGEQLAMLARLVQNEQRRERRRAGRSHTEERRRGR